MKLKLFATALALAGMLALGACGGNDSENTAAPTAPVADTAGTERATGPLPDEAFKAQLTVADPPARLAPGEKATLNVKIRNASMVAWPMRGRTGDGFFQVNLGDRWRDSGGKETKIDERIAMPKQLDRGAEIELALPITAPDKAGDYVLEIDMVQEGVVWFAQKGSESLKLNVKVVR
jgi:hypothetical protein